MFFFSVCVIVCVLLSSFCSGGVALPTAGVGGGRLVLQGRVCRGASPEARSIAPRGEMRARCFEGVHRVLDFVADFIMCANVASFICASYIFEYVKRGNAGTGRIGGFGAAVLCVRWHTIFHGGDIFLSYCCLWVSLFSVRMQFFSISPCRVENAFTISTASATYHMPSQRVVAHLFLLPARVSLRFRGFLVYLYRFP